MATGRRGLGSLTGVPEVESRWERETGTTVVKFTDGTFTTIPDVSAYELRALIRKTERRLSVLKAVLKEY